MTIVSWLRLSACSLTRFLDPQREEYYVTITKHLKHGTKQDKKRSQLIRLMVIGTQWDTSWTPIWHGFSKIRMERPSPPTWPTSLSDDSLVRQLVPPSRNNHVTSLRHLPSSSRSCHNTRSHDRHDLYLYVMNVTIPETRWTTHTLIGSTYYSIWNHYPRSITNLDLRQSRLSRHTTHPLMSRHDPHDNDHRRCHWRRYPRHAVEFEVCSGVLR